MFIGICDDDRLWRQKAGRIIQTFGLEHNIDIELIYFDGPDALDHHEAPVPDVLFMDIELEHTDLQKHIRQKSGIDAARQVNERWPDCQIVYLTNYLYYATEVYQTSHVFFMLKNTFESRIDEVFEKIFHEKRQKEKKLIFSALNREILILAPEDILYFEREKRITHIITRETTHEIRTKLDELERVLPAPDFVRCHNSYIIYLPAVKKLIKGTFIMENNKEILISRKYMKTAKKTFMSWISTQLS